MCDIRGSIPEVPLSWFQENILPPLPEQLQGDGLLAVLNKMKKEKLITSNGYWKKFTAKPSSQSAKHEREVYQPFETLADDIAQAARGITKLRPTVVFKCNPDMCPESGERETSSKPDGYGLFTRHESYEVFAQNRRVYWQFVVAAGEKKKVRDPKTITDVSHTAGPLSVISS